MKTTSRGDYIYQNKKAFSRIKLTQSNFQGSYHRDHRLLRCFSPIHICLLKCKDNKVEKINQWWLFSIHPLEGNVLNMKDFYIAYEIFKVYSKKARNSKICTKNQ